MVIDEERIVKLIKSGKKIADICIDLRIGRERVCKIKKKYGLMREYGGRKKDPAKKFMYNGRMVYKCKYNQFDNEYFGF